MRGLADGITSSYQVGGPPCGRSRSACGGPAGCASLRGCGPAPQGARVRAPGALGALPLGPHPSPAARPFGPGVSGSPGPCPPLPGGRPGPPGAAWPPARSGSACPFGAPLASSLARWLRPVGAGALRLARLRGSPGGPRLRAWARPRLRPRWQAAPGASRRLALGPPCGALRPPCVGGRPWPSPGLALRSRRRPGPPCPRPGPAGRGRLRRPGSLPPVGRLGGPVGPRKSAAAPGGGVSQIPLAVKGFHGPLGRVVYHFRESTKMALDGLKHLC